MLSTIHSHSLERNSRCVYRVDSKLCDNREVIMVNIAINTKKCYVKLLAKLDSSYGTLGAEMVYERTTRAS